MNRHHIHAVARQRQRFRRALIVWTFGFIVIFACLYMATQTAQPAAPQPTQDSQP